MISVPLLGLGLSSYRELERDLPVGMFLRITTNEWGESEATPRPWGEMIEEPYVVSTLFSCSKRPLAATYNESTHTLTVSVEGGVP